MKNASALSSTLLSVLLFVSFISGCSDSSKSVSLRDGTPAPAPGEPTPGEKPGTSPTPSPTPGEEPTPAPTPEEPEPTTGPVARFICENAKTDPSVFNTLPANAISSFQTESLVPFFNGEPLARTYSAVPLQSDGHEVFFIMTGKEDAKGAAKVYRGTARLLDAAADVDVLSNYPGVPKKGQYPYENLKLSRRVLAANEKRTSYVYPASNGTYTWENLKGSTFPLPLNANTSFNPAYIGADDYLRFEQESERGGTIVQKIFSFLTKKVISLPAAADTKDSQLFAYIDSAKKNIYWVEGRPETSWKIRMASLNSPAKAITLGTLSGNTSAIRLPMTFLNHEGETLLAYAEEQLALSEKKRLYLRTGLLHLVKISSAGKISSEKAVPYSEEIQTSSPNETVLAQGVLDGVFFEPLSGRLFSTYLTVGGLVSFDLNSNTWRTHGARSGLGCYNPQWGIEVTNE